MQPPAVGLEDPDADVRIAEALLVHETLTAEQIASLVAGRPLGMTPETSRDGLAA